MKKLFFLFFSIAIAIHIKAQIVNINPDPNGEPWLVGGYYVSDSAQLLIDGLPEFELTEIARNKTIPSVVDNSTKMYFRPIFSQDGGSCAQASGVGYVFTYMINRMRNTSASYTTNQYPTSLARICNPSVAPY